MINIGTKTKKTAKDITLILRSIKENGIKDEVAIKALDVFRDITTPKNINISNCTFNEGKL